MEDNPLTLNQLKQVLGEERQHTRKVIQEEVQNERQHTRKVIQEEVQNERQHTREVIQEEVQNERQHTRQIVRQVVAEQVSLQISGPNSKLDAIKTMLEEDHQGLANDVTNQGISIRKLAKEVSILKEKVG